MNVIELDVFNFMLYQPCLAANSTQMNWLQKDLASVDRTITPWVFAVFHEPYMNSNNAHSMSKEGYPMQQAIEKTLYDAKVRINSRFELLVFG